MDAILTFFLQSVQLTLLSLWHNWPYLLVSILVASALKVFLEPERISAFLRRNRRAGVVAATVAAVATPLCSCGTMAILLGMMTSLMPWAPIIAFMVASPLTSPGELVYSAGLFGWPFAITFFSASIVLGLAGGLAGGFLESRGFFANQSPRAVACPACAPEPTTGTSPACGCSAPTPAKRRVDWRANFKSVYSNGKQLLLLFLGFAFIGNFLNCLIPSTWITAIFGSGHVYSVPLAATLGLPFYISSEASLPLIRSMLDAGMSQGAAMAFMIAGAGTSIGAIAGALTIARWRVVATVVATLWIGAMGFGYLYNLLLTTGWF